MDNRLLSIVDLCTFDGKRYANAGLIVRLEGDQVIIERDMNNKMLVDALLQAGVLREQIVLAYAGEMRAIK
ncbi:MAG TPA: element excision factor XisI family protein [Aggregatilineales bacterium]|nr:element excision factor XisI family protein [Aggregatilineales bacterium]